MMLQFKWVHVKLTSKSLLTSPLLLCSHVQYNESIWEEKFIPTKTKKTSDRLKLLREMTVFSLFRSIQRDYVHCVSVPCLNFRLLSSSPISPQTVPVLLLLRHRINPPASASKKGNLLSGLNYSPDLGLGGF